MAPKAIVAALGGKARVYDPYVLLRSLEVWQARTELVIPDDIRVLLEATYLEREEPDSWLKLCDEGYAQTLVYRQKALTSSNIWQAALDDQEGVQTRLNELPTVSLILSQDGGTCFIDGTAVPQATAEFSYQAARAIHRSLVKVPAHHFSGVSSESALNKYLYEQHTVGNVADDGSVTAKGLNDGIKLSYSDELGLVVEKSR